MIRIDRVGVWGIVFVMALTACADTDSEAADDELRPPQETDFWATQPADTIAGHPAWTGEDWTIFSGALEWGWSEGIDAIPMGDAMVRLGQTFLGTTYTPQTLEAPGHERLVVNFRELDCVTFVETILALNRFLRSHTPDVLDDPTRAMTGYEEILTSIRYRSGVLDGYASRLHYFVDWIGDNERKGHLVDVTSSLGGIVEEEPIHFMSRHPDSYRQLADGGELSKVLEVERELSNRTRYFIPETEIATAASDIRDGDIIAATSTVEGLDVAHTGIALWIDGVLHLMHAPLVGQDVQISEQSLSDRILRIGSQDGIVVGRPTD